MKPEEEVTMLAYFLRHALDCWTPECEVCAEAESLVAKHLAVVPERKPVQNNGLRIH